MDNKIKKIFSSINFVKRYQKICEDYNDFENSMTNSNKKKYLEIINSINDNLEYSSKDRTFKYSSVHNNYVLELVLSLHKGLIEAHLNYLNKGEWIMYNRFDGYAEELEKGFRDKLTIPKYTSYEELEEILKEIFSIYEDFKEEFIKQYT